MTLQTRVRIPYLDFLKCFAIASVLLGHSVEQITGNDFWDNPIWSFIYSYHMPLFMFLCGYFFSSSLKRSFSELVRKKFVQLWIPSLTAFALMFLFVWLTNYNPCPELMDFSWFGFFNAVWFLKSVFFCYLIGYISLKLFHTTWIAAFISSFFVLLFPIFNTDNIDYMLPMFWLGYLCKINQSAIDKNRKKLLICSTLLFALLLIKWSGRLTVYMVPIHIVDWVNMTFEWHNFGVTIYRMIIGMVGSMFFFLLSPIVYEKIANWRITPILNNIGKCTLGIYWLQTFLLECTWHGIGLYVNTTASFVITPIIMVFELTLCYQLVLLLKRNKVTKLMILGER